MAENSDISCHSACRQETIARNEQSLEKRQCNEERLRHREILYSFLLSCIEKQIPVFAYDPKTKEFSEWIFCFERALATFDDLLLSDKEKTWFLISKLDVHTYTTFADYIMPRKVFDLQYDEIKQTLEVMFGKDIFSLRYDFFRMEIGDTDLMSFGGKINRMYEVAQIDKMTREDFKCLMFVRALRGPEHAEVRSTLLGKLSQKKDCSVNDLVDECRRFKEIQLCSLAIDEAGRHDYQNLLSCDTPSRGACFTCGEKTHYAKLCPIKKQKKSRRGRK